MKITDILEMFEPNVSSASYDGKLVSRYSLDPDTPSKATGNFSNVRPDKKDPHMVRKNHHSPVTTDTDDGYIPFINYLIDNKLMGQYVNLPRVYDIKKIQSKRNDGFIYTYTMEKLIDGNSLTMDELNLVIDRTLGDKKPLGMTWIKRVDCTTTKTLNQWFGAQLEKAVGNGYNVIDPEVVKALEIIDTVAKSEEILMTDIHGGNIMYRRTPYGLQLVFTDPIA